MSNALHNFLQTILNQTAFEFNGDWDLLYTIFYANVILKLHLLTIFQY